MILGDFFDAFQAGKELSSAATWKKAQLAASKLAVLLGAVVSIAAAFGYTIQLTTEQIVTIAGAVVAVAGLFNGTATVVSTSRIGLSPRGNNVRDGRPDAGLDGIGDRATEEPDRGSDGVAGSDASLDDQVSNLRDMYRG